MKLLTFSLAGSRRIGVYARSGVVDLRLAYAALHEAGLGPEGAMRNAERLIPCDMPEFLELGEPAMEATRRAVEHAQRLWEGGTKPGWALIHSPEAVRVEAPVPRPGKIFALAGNYAEHYEESGMKAPVKTRPYVFTKPSTSVIGPGQPIVLPSSVTKKVDWEAELAVVIGRRGKYIPRERAYDHIAGYTLFNDVSCREFTERSVKAPDTPRDEFFDWLNGKWLDTFAAMGPHIVTKDEVENPQNLRITLSVNGDVKQDSNTKYMIFTIPEIVEYISTIATLEPGDIISTGTPSGVGEARGEFLKPGDVVEVEVERVGVLRNSVVEETLGT